MKLLQPTLELLPRYIDALERGWSFNYLHGADGARVELEEIARDAAAFVARKTDREARGGPVKLPDGSEVPRLPGYQLWMWEEDFCGVISFRWAPGTPRLPAHVLGHIGYGVVPWMRGRGCATAALALMRERVRAEGLPYADITCDPDNEPSRKVIVANGGAPFERFDKPASNGGTPSFRCRWYTGLPHPMALETERLRLRQWRDEDLAPFAALGADPEVMRHFPACLSREESDAVVARARAGIDRRGWGFWAVERRADGAFLGMAGVTVVPENMPFYPVIEVGWRFARHAWGQGYATEAARAALRVAFDVLDFPQVVAFTAVANQRSAAVMQRLGMREDAPFDHPALPVGHPQRRHRLFRITACS
jgi:RimJ/RimL family protein N-acetyltransferase